MFSVESLKYYSKLKTEIVQIPFLRIF